MIGEIQVEITAKITVAVNKWAHAFEIPLAADAVAASIVSYYSNVIAEANLRAPGVCAISSQVHREA
ncbi:hypothetical protein FraEuI1c_1498 [Pseudofrankia inefficax]|uniref:Uncharacterized protein n=1 Tax=Pseudofrankia inefficax (strain DSM 45817 / CECT 9037 / DDB 130130 / EuI1c) TaxID=298654 RepID=E3J6D3_PSEI1|nr:hypothetical protein FraEuI1c_1498 [Pseudofrankia inefficax]